MSRYIREVVDNRTNRLSIALTVYLCTYFVYTDFYELGFRIIYGVCCFALAIMIGIINRESILFDANCGSFCIIMATIFLSYFRTMSNPNPSYYPYIGIAFICFLTCLTATPDINQFETIEKIVWLFSGLFAFVIIISRINMDLYLNTFFRILSNRAREQSVHGLWHGYSCTIAGDFGYSNYMFMLAAILALRHVISTEQHYIRYSILSAFFVMASFFTGRRGEFFSLLLTCFFILLLAGDKNVKRKFFKFIVFSLIVIGFLWPVIVNSPIFLRYSLTISGYENGEDIASGRLPLWEHAISLFLDNPILGIGWGQFAYNLPDGYSGITNVHNIYIQFLAETGLVGAFLILFGVFKLLIHSLGQVKILKGYRFNNLLGLSTVSLGIQFYFLVLGIFDPCFMKYFYWCFFTFAVIIAKYIDASIRNAIIYSKRLN